ncbi:hypothetical protein RAS1_39030 [Phycisphaerae bacterium RAS1]|nr:hypothetical protein RAS1_39030 [Phycisphaerae bacterium RAS1]
MTVREALRLFGTRSASQRPPRGVSETRCVPVRALACASRSETGQRPALACASRSGVRRLFALAAVSLPALFLALPAGCRATLSHGATSQPAEALPRSGNAELMEYIGEMPFVSAEAAYRAVYVLHTGEVFNGDFAALGGKLAELKIIDGGWRLNADDVVNRSEVGYMVCRAAGVNSGLNWRLTGLGRYAWRELNYRGIVRGQIGEYGYVSGGQFLGILSRAEEYMTKRELRNVQQTSLGAPPS